MQKGTESYSGTQTTRKHEATGPWGLSRSLPLTVSVAEVPSCLHTQEYSPASSTVRPRISSSHTAPSCFRLTLAPALRVSGPFLHSTGAALLSSQRSMAVAPSVASSFFRPFVNLAGRAAGGQKDTKTLRLSVHTHEVGNEEYTEDTTPNWTQVTGWCPRLTHWTAAPQPSPFSVPGTPSTNSSGLTSVYLVAGQERLEGVEDIRSSRGHWGTGRDRMDWKTQMPTGHRTEPAVTRGVGSSSEACFSWFTQQPRKEEGNPRSYGKRIRLR